MSRNSIINTTTKMVNEEKNEYKDTYENSESIIVSPEQGDTISTIEGGKRENQCLKWSLTFNLILVIGLCIALYFLFPPPSERKLYNKVPEISDEEFKLNKHFYMMNYNYRGKGASWVSWRNAKNDFVYENLDPKYQFWTDKMKSHRCLDGLDGLKFVPILWYTSIWNEANKSRLRRFLETYDYETNGALYLKPSHLTNSNGPGMTISNPSQINPLLHKVDELTKGDLENLTKRELEKKIPMTKEKFQKYIALWKKHDHEIWKNDWRHVKAIPGIMIQPEFDLEKYPEVKFNVVFGKVVNFKIDAKNRISVSNEDRSLECMIKSRNGCAIIWNLMDWDKIIPKIEGFVNKVHIEYLRVDIFPTSETDFYINEIEVLSSARVDGSEEIAHKGVVDILRQKNEKIRNSTDQQKYFLPNENDFDFLCDVENLPYLEI